MGFANFYSGDEAGLAGKRSDIVISGPDDTTAPTIAVKPESKGRDGVYSTVSFALADESGIYRLTLTRRGRINRGRPAQPLRGS
jgi:hypothetical protein